ncbi:TatD DNase domain containing 3, variant [Capsaspora owczarzaki ATCC 30864]|uniref:TatD DNase domain containing 3, variant n=1 Tax=Capsaspora owczarzaki (strain ATCC 30864) TaxID=595528 RepID=A0A0D2US36_CAPO3|nr:TatD DNase domain containing 3, variant [Capsaspora owczarzaki ATCC 30864]
MRNLRTSATFTIGWVWFTPRASNSLKTTCLLILLSHLVRRVLELAAAHPEFAAPCLGIHPVQHEESGVPRPVRPEETAAMMVLLEKHADVLVAVGEIGLDYSPWILRGEDYRLKKLEPTAEIVTVESSTAASADPNERERIAKANQIAAFREQVLFAKAHGLPVNVHSRNAGKYVVEMLAELQADKVLLHAFDGSAAVAKRAVALGYCFSVPPNVVRSPHFQQVVATIPIENLLLETDAPALAPLPKPAAAAGADASAGDCCGAPASSSQADNVKAEEAVASQSGSSPATATTTATSSSSSSLASSSKGKGSSSGKASSKASKASAAPPLAFDDLVPPVPDPARNEPANVYLSAQAVARIKNIPVEEVVRITTANAIRIFPKLARLLA